MDEKELKELMIARSEEFKKLHEEHKKQEEKLRTYETRDFLSDAEKLEEKEIKKRKLVLKDRMYKMMTEFRKSL